VNQLPPDLLSTVLPLVIVLLSLTVHEAAHAWTSDRLGDPTARLLGRVSLNPIVHIDLIGTIILPLLAVISNLPIIGWAKPVPVDIRRLRQPRRDFMLVAAAGPVSNLLIALVASLVVRALFATADPSVESSSVLGGDFLARACLTAVTINVLLAVFNLVPVPPLDGGNVLAGLLPPSAAAVFINLQPFGFIILYALMFTGILSAIIMPPAFFLMRLLIP
jgi:Zn-dependent protease